MKKRAFTLAEVLITLTIIGVIAALTIPNLMQKWADNADVVKVKKEYSILNNAMKLTIAENGPLDDWDWPEPNQSYSYANSRFLADKLLEHLKVQKYCNNNNGPECFNKADDLYTKKLNGEKSNQYTDSRTITAILEDGTSLWISSGQISNIKNGGDNDSRDMKILIDINGGKKGPNRYGYDIFYIEVKRNKLSLADGELHPCLYNSGCRCDRPSDYGGLSCAAWIIRKGNMDYKYRDVSAEW